MADEATTSTATTPTTDETKPDPVAEKDREIAALRADLGNAQSLITDPAYQEWIAAKAARTVQQHIDRKEAKTEEVDYSKLSPKEFKELLKEELKAEMSGALEARVMPVEQKQALDNAVAQVKECRAKYEDFDQYNEAMQRIALEYPAISAERCYKLAKAEHPEIGKKHEEKKQAAAKAELPSGSGTKIVKAHTEKGLPAAFGKAWAKVMGASETAH